VSDRNDGDQDRMAGKFKQGAGKLTGDEKMESEGRSQESKGTVKKKVEDAGDSVKGAIDGITGRD
jgi:uncharacterized protein YjbJ (UPF0337 family)